ncbi:MAG: 5-methyltetrahydropteroyltriglutamate--homocysteine S-methyltransferase, partial [Thermomicrobium sp.]|nr:5-methyltetrahydropteroyltriglutamate--homocysteine S-methyltransferase [Thermomicrobium sp.]
MAKSSLLGYPRIGKRRELKRALERYWAGETDETHLLATARAVREAAWRVQLEAGIDLIPCNDFSLYDHVLDTICLVGLVPVRFGAPEPEASLPTYFAMARGAPGIPALELTKWFDTNYHYLVPEFDAPGPRLASAKPFEEFAEATQFLGRPAKPVLLGPVSLLLLGKRWTQSLGAHLEQLLPIYREVLERLATAGAEWVQLDEPVLVQDRTVEELQLVRRAYRVLDGASPRPKIMLQTYYGSLDDAGWDVVTSLPVEGVGLDFVRGEGNRALLNRHGFPRGKVLGAGVVDGRNVWRTNLVEALEKLEEILEHIDAESLWVQPSCPLLHLPHDVRLETSLPESVRLLLAFAEQRLEELVVLTRAINQGRQAIVEELERNAEAFRVALDGERLYRREVRERLAALTEEDFRRRSPYEVRESLQR